MCLCGGGSGDDDGQRDGENEQVQICQNPKFSVGDLQLVRCDIPSATIYSTKQYTSVHFTLRFIQVHAHWNYTIQPSIRARLL